MKCALFRRPGFTNLSHVNHILHRFQEQYDCHFATCQPDILMKGDLWTNDKKILANVWNWSIKKQQTKTLLKNRKANIKGRKGVWKCLPLKNQIKGERADMDGARGHRPHSASSSTLFWYLGNNSWFHTYCTMEPSHIRVGETETDLLRWVTIGYHVMKSVYWTVTDTVKWNKTNLKT